MGVFKAYIKICKNKSSVILIYMLIFAGVLFMLSQESANESKTFTDTKIRTAFINKDKESLLSQGLYEYLDKYCEFMEVPEEKIDDALFIREVEYVIEIEEGFEERFFNGGQALVKRQSIPDSFASMAINGAINNYLNTAAIIKTYIGFKNTAELVDVLKTNMALESNVSLFDPLQSKNDNGYYETYFNYLSYVMVASFILIIGTIMATFQKRSIKRRNLAAPISIRNLNLKLLFCNALFTTVFLVVFVIFGVITSRNHVINKHLMLYGINAFAFSMVVLALSYLFGMVLNNTKSLTLVSTVVSLGFAFLGGVFVPLEMFSSSTLKIAQFVPSYWYVLTNHLIGKLSNFSGQNIAEVFGYITLQLIMALVLFGVCFGYSRLRSKQEGFMTM